jgi:hypothetical protein
MKMSSKLAFAAMGGIAALLSLASPADAHHSFAMFDQTKTLSKTRVTVAEFRFTNPHSFVVVSAKGANGAATRYTLECNSVNMMSRAGWKRNTLRAGDRVDVVYYPLRDGRPGGMLKTIKLPTGRTLNAW